MSSTVTVTLNYRDPPVNKNVPAVPKPVGQPNADLATLNALKEGVESLSGQRGRHTDRAVTFNDLIALGLTPAGLAGAAADVLSAKHHFVFTTHTGEMITDHDGRALEIIT